MTEEQRRAKRDRDGRYYASELGQANRARENAARRERYASDPDWRLRRKCISRISFARRVLAEPVA